MIRLLIGNGLLSITTWLLQLVCVLTGGHDWVVTDDSDIYYDELTCTRCLKTVKRPIDGWSI